MGLLLDTGYAAALTAASPWLLWRSIKTGRYRDGWNERLFGMVPESRDKPSIWLHGVSLGEVQLLVPLAKQLEQTLPKHHVVLSTSTLTGMRVARESLTTTRTFVFPFDFSWAMRRAISRLRPELIVLGELEVWPHLVAEAHRRRIPVAVVNGRLSDKSFRGYSRFRSLLKPTFEKLSLVAAQNDSTAERFAGLGTPKDRIVTTGSLKFDNVNLSRSADEIDRLRKLVGLTSHHRVIVAGSTQDPEEVTMAKAWLNARDQHPNSKLIIVPRHPERFNQVYTDLTSLSLRVQRRSLLCEPVKANAWDVLLVDCVGELRWWWGLAELALVGGSFGSRGGQNMLEPAAYGANVAFGPNTWNFKQIAESLLSCEGALRLESLEGIDSWLSEQLDQPEPGKLRGQRAVEFIQSQQGAMHRTLEQLLQLLPNGVHQATTKRVAA